MRFSLILVLATAALPAAAQVPLVLTDIPPVNALVAQVMGSLGTPVQLLERGADEHDLHLRPSQVQALNAAQLLVWVGPELTPGLESVVQSAPAALRSLALLDDPATRRRSFADGAGTDPHAWLDPVNAATWLTLIAGELAHPPDQAPALRWRLGFRATVHHPHPWRYGNLVFQPPDRLRRGARLSSRADGPARHGLGSQTGVAQPLGNKLRADLHGGQLVRAGEWKVPSIR